MIRRSTFFASVVCILGLAALAWAAEAPLSEAIRSAAAAVRPAVVTIEVKGRGLPVPGAPQPFKFFIWPGPEGEGEFQLPPGIELPPGFQMPKIPQFRELMRETTEGSGVIVEVQGQRGLIAVPESLVARAQNVAVKLADGRQFAAKVLGSDKFTGTACLEIQGPNLVAAKLGNAEALQVGDPVVAVGGPATGGAVTAGIISAKDRPGTGDLVAARLILTDALVAEAMAGGPLVNLKGEVIGVTCPSASRGGRGRDLTAVLPVSVVQTTAATLAREGKVEHGWLGLTFGPLPPDEREPLGLDHGVKVQAVLDGHPAAKAGIQAGDILLAFGGRKIDDAESFRALVATRRPGERVAVQLRRGGQTLTLEVILGEAPAATEPLPVPAPAPRLRPEAPHGPLPPAGGEKLPIGVTVQPLTPELAAQFGIAGDRGLLVTWVDPDGPAAKAREMPIERGDLIKEIARRPVATVAEAQQALKAAQDAHARSTLLLVRSRGTTRYVVVDLPQK